MWIFIEIDKMSIREIKLDDIAVISQFIKPINPIMVITAYVVEIRGINTHLKFLKIIFVRFIKISRTPLRVKNGWW